MKRRSGGFLRITAAAAAACLCACQSASATEPAQVVQAYLAARAQSDANKMVGLSCAAWEAQAKVEASSFRALKARLDNVSCSTSSTGQDSSSVICQGRILTDYDGETRAFDVSARRYRLVKEAGDWRLCGYE